MNPEIPKSLTLKQEQLIMSYPVYFHQVLRESALNGEDIKTIAEELEQDWAGLT